MKRLMEMAKILLESEKPITIKEIANELNISNKTVRNDLKKLQDFIEKEGLRLTKKTGVGTSIEGPEDNKLQLLRTVKKSVDYIQPYSPGGRQKYILKKLFMDGGNMTSYELADELYVSTGTIHKDIKEIEKWINDFNLKLVKKRNYGIEIIGEEDNYRKAISALIDHIKETDEIKGLLQANYKGRIDEKTLCQLKALINIDYLKLEGLVSHVEEQLNFRFSHEAYISLIIHIAISIKRIKKGYDIFLSEKILENIKDTKAFYYAEKMSCHMEKYFNVKIPTSEVGYITLHILGSKMHGRDLATLTFESAEELDLAVEIGKDITKIASEALHMNLIEDQVLLNGLILHLRPTINRIKYGLTLKNPIIEEIKSNYPDVFGVAWMCSRVFQKYLDVNIPESEIGYIALHLGAAVERNSHKVKTIIVCHSGIGTSQLLSARFKRCFKEIDVIGIYSSAGLTKDIMDEAQMIISTVPIKVDRPVILVSPLFTQMDVKKVEKHIDSIQMRIRGEEEKEFICKEVFHRSKRFNNRSEIIEEMCENLEKKEYIKKSFKGTVLKRESLMATEIGNSIAIPHGEPSEVKKSCIALTVLEEPVKWESEWVKYVFLICLAKKDIFKTKNIIKNLYNRMDDKEFINSLNGHIERVKTSLNNLENTM
ncbi:BglG family transcription antiterminator [Anaeromicrobium sediminis]|uniref:Uncharacterized protein n=1 Tax=Anaeromicrobium sediminis TaxID=1478221 RepID=A0A267MG31_9FIRM|nr:BglG family transcription antiterminator [Anaeromicrobium sediminis]PAB57868.1 hypothetical protein CCE28_17885 [Anaeromicrobium sediminis]